MQPIPEDVMTPDVWQWLNNGWFFHDSGDGKLCPAYMENSGGDLTVMRVDGNEYDYVRHECFPHWPDCGAVNLHGFAVILDRIQSRQYRRTYNTRCVELQIPRKWEVMKRYPMAKTMTADTPEVVNAVFTPTYYTYTRALELLGSGWVSVALNPHLIVVGDRDSHLLYYRGKLLAKVEGGIVEPIDPANPRNIRILKWLDGRVRYADQRASRQSVEA
jgi:hypothetical protein